LTDERALFLALVEGLERYSTCVHKEEQFIWAAADELGRDALDLDTLPKCSKTELLNPRCPLRQPTKTEPIRWVRGLSLREGRIVYIPAVMAYLTAGYESPAERISLSITTGCAAHTSFEDALLHGICEVVERDAISLVWLQKLTLPRISLDRISPLLSPYWNCYQRSFRHIECIFFDATTDVGIPTVYGIQIARFNTRLRTIVSCSTDLNPDTAIAKVIRDMASMSIALRSQRKIPDIWDDFSGVLDGAIYMARADQADAFDFLLQSNRRKLLSEMTASSVGNIDQRLHEVLKALFQAGREVYAVDLSTDEAVRSGIRAVRVLIPSLQPLSFHYRARYLGHPRLYDAPKQMGYTALPEEKLNRWPQPFG
jgi:ribosomal protein S12 methylthiotransferase accessory factor